MAKALDIPTEVMPSLPQTTVIISSNMCINIGSCERIITYDENYIKVEVKHFFIEITGENLVLHSCRDGSLELDGTITQIEFSSKKSSRFQGDNAK